MADFREKATKGLVAKEDEKMHHCTVCGTTYTKEGTALNHVRAKHNAEIELLAAELERKSDVQQRQYWLEDMQRSVDKIEESFQKAKAAFAEDFETNPVYAIKNRSEDMVKKQKTLELSVRVKRLLSQADTSDPSDCKILLEELTEYSEHLKSELLQSPPRHNSTCAWSNEVRLLEYETTVNYVTGHYGLDNLRAVVHATKRVVELNEKLAAE